MPKTAHLNIAKTGVTDPSTSNQTHKTSKITTALKKAIGSINKTLSLLEEQNFDECSDVLVQIDSAIGSLNSSRSQVLDHFLDICLDEHLANQDKSKLKTKLSKFYKLTR